MSIHANAHLNFTIAGKSANVGARWFADSLEDVLIVLNEIDVQLSAVEDGTVIWEIGEASTNSPLTITLVARPVVAANYGGMVVAAFFEGLESLDSDGEPAPCFTPRAINRLHDLNNHLESGALSITFATAANRFSPSRRFFDNVAMVAGKPAGSAEASGSVYYEIGELEGKVETLVGHNGNYFNLYDVLSGERIHCDFSVELQEQVRAAWQKRVIVGGRIQFTPDGKPRSMCVASIALKPPIETLPQFKDFGIDITGGIAPGDYVRDLRDA